MIKRIVIVYFAAAFGLCLSVVKAADKGAKGSVDLSKLPPASDKQNVTYTQDIKPMFDKACISCHGKDKAKAKLRLDSLEAALKGGEDGKVIEPGNSAGSMLVQNVAHIGDPDDYMPPPKNKAGIA